MIYQVHPNHGRHFATNDAEERENIKNGWKTVTEEEFYGKKEDPEQESEDFELSRDDLAELYELKFNKKPHHKMTAETIKAKLDE